MLSVILYFTLCRRDEVCSHMSALRFKVEAACQLGYNRITCTYIIALCLESIVFYQSNFKPVSPQDPVQHSRALHAFIPGACIFTSVSVPSVEPESTECHNSYGHSQCGTPAPSKDQADVRDAPSDGSDSVLPLRDKADKR